MFTYCFSIGTAKSPTHYYFKDPFLIGTEIFWVNHSTVTLDVLPPFKSSLNVLYKLATGMFI